LDFAGEWFGGIVDLGGLGFVEAFGDLFGDSGFWRLLAGSFGFRGEGAQMSFGSPIVGGGACSPISNG
jgi:hypothetical protein